MSQLKAMEIDDEDDDPLILALAAYKFHEAKRIERLNNRRRRRRRIIFLGASFLLILAIYYSWFDDTRSSLPASSSNSSSSSSSANNNNNDENADMIGLAFQGGSFTAATICAGILRGFQQQKIHTNDDDDGGTPGLDAFAYISSSSGGNIPATQYAFALDTTSDILLDAGGINDPSEITEEILEHIPEGSVFSTYATSSLNAMSAAASETLADGSVFFQNFMYHSALEPLGIPAGMMAGVGNEGFLPQRAEVKPSILGVVSMVGPIEAYPEWLFDVASQDIINDMVHEFPSNEKWSVESCVFSNCGSQPLTNADLVDIFRKNQYQAPLPCVATPYDLSCATHPANLQFKPPPSNTNTTINAVDPLHFVPFTANAKELSTHTNDPYTIEKFLGIATNGVPMSGLRPMGGGMPLDRLLRPATIDIPEQADGDTRRTMAFVDGGYNDRMGVPPLVVRGVQTIIATNFWTQQPDDELHSLSPLTTTIDEVRRYFGVFNTDNLESDPADPLTTTGIFNHIFDLHSNGEDQLRKLHRSLTSLHAAGNPLIVTLDNLLTVPNPFWGIEGGNRVDLTIITVRGVPRRFSEEVPNDVAPPPPGREFTENGFFTNEELRRVPNVLSGSNIMPFALDIEGYELGGGVPLEFGVKTKETRMTSILCSWMIKEAWDGLKGVHGETVFGGFKDILEKRIV